MNQTTKISLSLLVALGSGIGFYFFTKSAEEVTESREAATAEASDAEDLKTALIEQVRTKPETVEQVVEPASEATAPVVSEAQTPPGVFPREAAPDLNSAQLSPSLSRTYDNYAPLRTETYRNPDSEFNRSVVADLEAIRAKRNLNK